MENGCYDRAYVRRQLLHVFISLLCAHFPSGSYVHTLDCDVVLDFAFSSSKCRCILSPCKVFFCSPRPFSLLLLTWRRFSHCGPLSFFCLMFRLRSFCVKLFGETEVHRVREGLVVSFGGIMCIKRGTCFETSARRIETRTLLNNALTSILGSFVRLCFVATHKVPVARKGAQQPST